MSINCYTFVTNKATKHKRVNEKLPGRGPTTLAKTVRQRYDNFSVPQEKINIMKKIVKTFLAVACVSGIILAGCENPDGSCNIIWTLSWLGVAVLSGLLIKRMEEAR